MKRREFLKWSGLGGIFSLLPFNLFGGEKKYLLSDITYIPHKGNENILCFKDGIFWDRIVNNLDNRDAFNKKQRTSTYYIGHHDNYLDVKKEYSEKELMTFIDNFLSRTKNKFGFYNVYGSELNKKQTIHLISGNNYLNDLGCSKNSIIFNTETFFLHENL